MGKEGGMDADSPKYVPGAGVSRVFNLMKSRTFFFNALCCVLQLFNTDAQPIVVFLSAFRSRSDMTMNYAVAIVLGIASAFYIFQEPLILPAKDTPTKPSDT